MSVPTTEPVDGFTSFQLDPAIIRGIAAAGFTEPRPIQTRTIPAVLEGRDVLGLAQTGTGKTAAFGLPVLERLQSRPGAGPRVLILAPTRELASQIGEELALLARFTRIKIATVFGGVPASAQRKALRLRPEIIVACPGRLLDLLDQGALRLDRIETVILDEADHMFDMGFLPDVRRILAALPKRRQNLLFSATMPGEIRKLADGILREPRVVDLTRSVPALTIEHAMYPAEGAQKLVLLRRLITEDDFTSAIVFTRTKHRARRLARQLEDMGHGAVALQGNMSQSQRVKAMSGFRKGRFDILVATDIAARGIDVEKVSHVVNFDMPSTPEAYTHRIGRTGRAGCDGKAYTFITAEDDSMIRAVERKLGAAIPRRAHHHVPDAATGRTGRPARKARNARRSGTTNGRDPRGRSRSRRQGVNA